MRAARRFPCPCRWPISFGSDVTDYVNLTYEISMLVRLYPGWSLTELKHLTSRERRYWLDNGLWHRK